MLKKIEGIVISETPFKESSKILNILTSDGVYGVISKGCKNLRSNLRSVSNRFVYGEFTIYYHQDKLSTLKEGFIIDNFNTIKSDLKLISYMTYITELVHQVVKQNMDSSIYYLFIDTLTKIDEGMNPKVMMNIIEIKLLDYLGVGIELNGCAKCGTTKNIVTVDPDVGGYICANCYKNEIIYDEKVRKMLRMYYLVDIKSITELKINDYVIDSINNFLDIYYERYTGLYLNSKKFLNSIVNM